ncbi:hypothetical protein Lal_00001274 [Lupinus albus]|nr:hypothetical protein Lal_00001274 [Lupinus albus]
MRRTGRFISREGRLLAHITAPFVENLRFINATAAQKRFAGAALLKKVMILLLSKERKDFVATACNWQ